MYTPRSTIKNFYEVVKSGWEPTFDEVRNKYFPAKNGYDSMRNNELARKLVHRVSRMLRKEKLFFYSVMEANEDGVVTRHYKILTGAGERLGITGNLWNLATGFRDSTKELLEDTCAVYPSLERNALLEVKAAFSLIYQLSTAATLQLESAIKNQKTKETKKGGDKKK